METNGGGGGLESLLAQLRRTSNQQEPQSNQSQPHNQQPHQAENLLAQFTSYHQANQSGYYDTPPQEQHQQFPHTFHHGPSASGIMEAHMPSAPTPPVSGFSNAQFPPGMAGGLSLGRSHLAQSHQPQYPSASSYVHDHVDSVDRGNTDRPGNLLSLLNFSGSNSANQPGTNNENHYGSSNQTAPSPSEDHQRAHIHAPAPAPSDPSGLLAALMRGNVKEDHHEPAPQNVQAAPAQQAWASTATSADSQQYLLNLLNRPKPGRNEPSYPTDAPQQRSLTPKSPKEHAKDSVHGYPATEQIEGPVSHSQTEPHVPTGTFEFDSPKPKFDGGDTHGAAVPARASIFNYANPFEDLAASSPLNRTPKSTTTTPGTAASTTVPGPGQTTSLPIQILKKPTGSAAESGHDNKRSRLERSPLSTPEHTRRKLNDAPSNSGADEEAASTPLVITVSPRPEKQKESVTEAVSDRAGSPSVAAQDALDRAAHDQAQAEIVQDLNDMLHAKSEREFEESAHAAAQAIKKELEKEGNNSVLEDNFPADIARAVRNIVDEAAAAPVADSWESAEAEEVVVTEESEHPVKVYNFPMKPWISISVQDIEEDSRPVFREEAIIDIARLKKEFDQVDRNLVTASESYMTYGMSKAGGLRVIRQMDGKEAKLFTDTKDRIFNLALSSTPSDQSAIQKECIIGTGIGGTVYWVQVRDGEKDHLEDANPEQYGFALPPITSQEGDAPGGVLKTRARASTMHPEYFAVGRGKSINIVWPGFIMQNALFQPGHDRVVDTQRLAKQCSLKINTGKAGKDFTFSQDDTTVVSLDKSGRVKFWDVRDLTMAKEGSDNRLPAQTSLEVKEPLLTLTTTPEGEKAWPTSIMLLDKLRPYQKRGALRYMVVGMKQNHTLQLWDLALGKPVQELNLPHSKESDAVCSVMYHPPTGMIVVGHPTRNSIYFLHLSSPKYSLKTMSQVDYILRLNAQDSSIPQPESTAVISGIREYSFGNKGVLRSLDILQTPTSSAEGEGEDQALFELYGMHSKGVTCIVVKQAELGWTRDNKVIAPVDAVECGVVKIKPLRPVPSLPVGGTAHPPEEPAIKAIMPRAAAGGKEAAQSTPTSQDDGTVTPRKAGAHTRPKDKEDDGAAQVPPPTPHEKGEKKGRKKKAAAAAAAAMAAAATVAEQQGQTNGNSHSPNVGPLRNSEGANNGRAASSATVASFPSFSQIQDSLDSRLSAVETRVKEHFAHETQASGAEVAKKLEASLARRDGEFDKKFKTLLDMVSSVLNDNTQSVLKDLILKQFKSTLVPVLRDDVAKSVSDQVSSRVQGQISKVVQSEVQRLLPGSVATALQQKDLVQAISDKVGQTVARNVDEVMVHAVATQIIPNFTTLAAQATQQVGNDILRQVSEELGRVEQVQRADAAKIDELVALTTHLSETVSSMASAQARFQAEFLKRHEPPAPVHTLPPPPAQIQQQHPYQQQQQQQQQYPVLHQQPHLPQQQHYAGSHHSSQHQTPARHPHPQGGHSQLGSVISGHGGSSYHSPGSGSNHLASPPHSRGHHGPPAAPAPSGGSSVGSQLVYAPAAEDPEIELLLAEVEALMNSGKHNDAMMKWLQCSPHEQLVFGRVLKKYNPDFIRNLQPLVLISVGATVSIDIEGPVLREKLAWIEMVLLSFHQLLPTLEPEILSVTPKILELIKSRIETIFMKISNTQANDAALKNLAQMIALITRMINQVKPRQPAY